MEAFHAIQRVVSGEDFGKQQQNDTTMMESSDPEASADQQRTNRTPEHSSSHVAHLVEPEASNNRNYSMQQQHHHQQQQREETFDAMEGVEEDEPEAPLRIIEHGTLSAQGPGGEYHSSSSLSTDVGDDGDDDGDNNDHHHHHHQHDGDEQLVTLQEEAPPKMRRMGGLQRMSSQGADSNSSNSQRAPSSQNSSRDWGWFFGDLHLDENGNPIRQNSEKDQKIKSDENGAFEFDILLFLLFCWEAEELCMYGFAHIPFCLLFVLEPSANLTAPNYVLEESLSSQKLWKESAGQRPPQPVEERAFYEKMWAQNFARSQVDYQMPVEVLTAASPVSLNPFADGNFDGAGDGDYAVAPPQTKNGGTSDVAEGMLVHRMNDHDRPATTVVNKKVKTGEGDLTVLVRGDNVFGKLFVLDAPVISSHLWNDARQSNDLFLINLFTIMRFSTGTTVSKSFARSNENGDPIAGVDTINISIASYRVVESKKHGKYAQFLVIYREGSIRDTIGIWKRYSDFEELANKVTHSHESCAAAFANISPLSVAEEPETEHLPNAITSWRLLKKRQRWYRCLDAGYLSLKVFLLERFLHDILFESSSPQLLRDFVGVSEDLM